MPPRARNAYATQRLHPERFRRLQRAHRTMKTTSRLAARLQSLNDKRNALLDELSALDPAKLVATPRPGKWSMLEIIEHLVLAERFVFKDLRDPSQLEPRRRRLKHRLRYALVSVVLTAGIPVEVPSPAMVPRGGRTLHELRTMWDENLDGLRALINRLDDAGARRAVFYHPVTGPLNVEHALRLDQIHLAAHARQIRRLQRLLA